MEMLDDKDFRSLKELLAYKCVEQRVLEKEISFLRKRFKDQMQFRDEGQWFVRSAKANFKLKEVFQITPPSNGQMDSKRALYIFLQKKYPDWYRKKIEISWKDINDLANKEIDEVAKLKKTWVPWPGCKWEEGLKLEMRLRPGALKRMYDKRCKQFGFEI